MKTQTAEEKYRRMTETPVKGLILTLSVPTIISNLISTLYNAADTFFVGQISTSASAAVGVALSLQAVIQAIGFFFGQGSGNNMSRRLGAHDEKTAEELASTGFFSSLLLSVAITVIGIIFLRPLAIFLGSSDTILPYAMDYMFWILIASPFMASSLVLNNQLRFEGNSFYSMIGLTTGGILNLFLDPLFIFVFDVLFISNDVIIIHRLFRRSYNNIFTAIDFKGIQCRLFNSSSGSYSICNSDIFALYS